VPSADACSKDRTFYTRSECELIQGNHLPTGMIEHGGVGMLPLRDMAII
jgi:hypothetical protein